MIYKVKAKFNQSKAKEFHKKLTDGIIQKQQPDGLEMVDSMKRATIDDKGYVNWTELCYCPSLLMHERATVLDKYFTDMETESIENHETYEGKSFMEHLLSF
jgi:hypothetical protein